MKDVFSVNQITPNKTCFLFLSKIPLYPIKLKYLLLLRAWSMKRGRASGNCSSLFNRNICLLENGGGAPRATGPGGALGFNSNGLRCTNLSAFWPFDCRLASTID